MKFEIRYGLGGGFGGCENKDWEPIEADSLEEAENEAYEQACQEYEMYEGMHGLRSAYQIMEEDGLDEDEAEEEWREERESWLDYEARETPHNES